MTDFAPPTPTGVIAYLTVKDAAAAIAFYTAAFGGHETFRQMADDGARVLHARLAINEGVVMLSDDFPEYTGGHSNVPVAGQPRGVVLHLQVGDCDAVFGSAVAAGATVLMPPADMFWGDRYARVRDPFGHDWSLGAVIA